MLLESVLTGALTVSACRPRETRMEFISTVNMDTMQTQLVSPVGLLSLDLDEFVRSDFMALRGVAEVRVYQVQNFLAVQVGLASFDRATRRKVYAKEKELYRQFPNHEFDFVLVDSSGTADNALGS